MNHESLDSRMQSLRTVVLTVPEKDALRAHVRGFVALNPAGALRKSWFARHAVAAAGIAIIVLATGTGAFAHYSRPGDPFYPIKLAVNDRVEVALAGDEVARLDKELELLARAIGEEEHLAGRELTVMLSGELSTGDDDGEDERRGDDNSDEEGDSEARGGNDSDDDEDDDKGSSRDLDSDLRDIDRGFHELELEADRELPV